MPRLLLPLGLILIASAAASWVGRPRAAEAPAPPADATKKEAFAPVGVAGCAAAACHHGNEPRGTKGSEYSTWIAVDPHAKAFAALYKPESALMHKKMGGDNKGAHRNPLCLKCHGMGDAVDRESAMQSDGVGCERCHGNAEKWKSTHYLDRFDRKQGFVDLRKLPVRVESCVKCHVGEGSMEVDHDLIAAGHPRLRFEYAAYAANYPRHWAETPLNKSTDDEVRGWLLGQVVSARAAAELLAHRADPKRDSWPEFAEYDCAACHHELKAKETFRTKRDLDLAEKRRKGEKPALGRLPWGTWYNPLLPTLATVTEADRAKLDASLKDLGTLMQKSSPNRANVREQAKALAASLRVWEEQIAVRPFAPTDTSALMKSLAARSELVGTGWDGGTQVYLGLASLNYHLSEGKKKSTAFVPPLSAMRTGLIDAYPKNPRPRYDVPSNYDPKPLLESMTKILDIKE